jgi:hypothetical protein
MRQESNDTFSGCIGLGCGGGDCPSDGDISDKRMIELAFPEIDY